jgi:agmatinase
VTTHLDLGLLLRPAGGGLYTVSTGRSEQMDLQCRLYGVDDFDEVDAAWRTTLGAVGSARVAILGIPSDCGAGLVRGAAYGPQALREAVLAQEPRFAEWAAAHRVIDVGDVPVVPQLLHDDMVSDDQREACRRALYAHLTATEATELPVAPLSIAERAVDLLLARNPTLRLFTLGGDHSVAWPICAALARRHAPGTWAIVQPDAHTDLLRERLGVKICFATWAYHANDLLGRGGRLVQVGTRASARSREHWEETLQVRQFWADEVIHRGETAVLDDLVAHLERLGIRHVYLSNDIDGTDAGAAPATGAPEPSGLTPAFVHALIGRLGRSFELCAADLVEVAPALGSVDERRRTLEVGAGYVLASLRAMTA